MRDGTTYDALQLRDDALQRAREAFEENPTPEKRAALGAAAREWFEAYKVYTGGIDKKFGGKNVRD